MDNRRLTKDWNRFFPKNRQMRRGPDTRIAASALVRRETLTPISPSAYAGYGRVRRGSYSRVPLTVALRRGMFESTADHPHSIQELSADTGLNPEGSGSSPIACVAGGYLECKKGKYRASAEAKKWLVKDSETYLGDLIYYFDSLNARLAGWTFSGTREPREPYYTFIHRQGSGETYVRGMANLATPSYAGGHAENPTPGRRRTNTRSRGLAWFSTHWNACRRFPGCTAVVMDFAPALHGRAPSLAGDMGTGSCCPPADILTAPLPPGQTRVHVQYTARVR